MFHDLALAIGLLACHGPPETKTDSAGTIAPPVHEQADNGVDDDADGCVDEVEVLFAFEPRTSDTLLEIVVADPGAAAIQLGLLDPGASEGGGWEGEACLVSTDCHGIDPTGGALRIVADTAAVVVGESTAFDSERLARAIVVLRRGEGCVVSTAGTERYPECCVAG